MYNHISELLGKATLQILDKEYSPQDSHPLKTRVGSGRRTCHKKKGLLSTITYGKKAIQDKVENQQKSLGYLTAQEIKKYGFLNGIVSTKNLLVAVVLHEYAHYIQTLDKKRFFGSVHNEHFYEILNNLHTHGFAEKVKDFLNQDNIFSQLSDQQIKDTTSNIKTGDFVVFQLKNGKELKQSVVRVNQKTVSTDSYRISYSFIKKHIPKELNKDNTTTRNNSNNDNNSTKFSAKNVYVGDYIQFKQPKQGNMIVKVESVHTDKLSVITNNYFFKVPYNLIIKKLTTDQIPKKSIIKDRDYFSYLKKGDEIKFKTKGKIEKAEIIRLNAKRATCKTPKGEFYVPYQLMIG